MLEFIKNNNTEYNERSLYRYKWLPKKNIYSMYRKLNTIYEFGGIEAVHNLLEIYDQTYIFGDDSAEIANITSVVFIYDPKGDISKYDYSEDFPVVLYDNRLGNFLGIPIKYWNKIKMFVLDCRSNLFLEIMKRWKTILVYIQPSMNKHFSKCARIYTRTNEPIVIWGDNKKFNEKVDTLKPSTITFKKDAKWENEYNRYKQLSNQQH
jgi:hypothetical protein